MKALTLRQPYATAIALGLKHVETRPAWAMRLRSMVGQELAIHAATRPVRDTPDERIIGDYRLRGVGRTAWAIEGPGLPPFRSTPRAEGVMLPFGCVVAVARVSAVVPIRGDETQFDQASGDWIVDTRPWYDGKHGSLRRIATSRFGGSVSSAVTDLADQEPWGDWTPGRVGIVLDQVRQLDAPVACRGYQQVWTLPDDVHVLVQRGLL